MALSKELRPKPPTGISAYLRGIPGLPPHLLAALAGRRPISREIEMEINWHIESLKARLREAREAHEALSGERIVPEPPAIIYQQRLFQ